MAKNVADHAKRCILFLGHNRGWEEAASSLAVRCLILRGSIGDCLPELSSASCNQALEYVIT